MVAFEKTGGIEKVNRTILKSLSFLADTVSIEAWSLYDNFVDEKYSPKKSFKGFNKNKIKYVIYLIFNCYKWDKIIVGHVNLAPVIRLIKWLHPQLKVVLIIHGIEVWKNLNPNRKWLLKNADKIISVSNYTKQIVEKELSIKKDKIEVIHNCLDYYFPPEIKQEKPEYLFERYNINNNCKVILTISRLSKSEAQKGYDKVIDALAKISHNEKHIDYKYLLCGLFDNKEYIRLNKLILDHNLTEKIIITGFISETELVDHYRLSDIYIMPSKKEGFGLSYIEAAACGLLVIAGNKDGSAEALMSGSIGQLINPDDSREIYNILLDSLKMTSVKNKIIADLAYDEYNFDNYSKLFNRIIELV